MPTHLLTICKGNHTAHDQRPHYLLLLVTSYVLITYFLLAITQQEPMSIDFETTTTTTTKAAKDFSSLPRTPTVKKRQTNPDAYFSAAMFIEPLKVARKLGGETLWVFMVINQQKNYGSDVHYEHPDYGWINVNKYVRDMYAINANQWKRGVDNLENAGLIEVRRKPGCRSRVRLLTKRVPKSKKRRRVEND
jgi:hypothetical protein